MELVERKKSQQAMQREKELLTTFKALRGPGGPRPGDGQNRVVCCILISRETTATRCFLPDQKILFLAKVITF